jgi:pilus assembly protein Flp/PilA
MSIKQFLQDEEGQSMVEYGVTLGAVAAVSYVAVVQLGDKTADLYAWMANHIPGGESDEVGEANQVRLTSDGLSQLTTTVNGAVFDTAEILASGTLLNNLGGNSALENPANP